MAGSLNKVMLIGHLGKDPEVRYTGSGMPVANFSIATNERRKAQDGNWEDRTEWHDIVVFGKLADICGQYLSKGRQVYIEGRLQTRNWTDKEGQKRYRTEIIANEMTMLGGPGGGGGGGAPRGGGGGGGGAPRQDDAPSYDGPMGGSV
ncbi:MAG: single-stranded DNA-binding protein, partial [Chrysiogenetes bacterium]|nr:single-stranded DNA-binding protein [Chrysiogenetes bacterium]